MKPETVHEDAPQICAEDLSLPPSQPAQMLDVLLVLSSRLRFLLAVTFGAAILTAVVVLLIPNKYTAAAAVLPPQQNSSMGMSSALLGQMGGSGILASLASGALGIKSSGEMYVSMFRSRTVEDAMIQRFGLMARYHKKNMVDARRAFEWRSTAVLGVKDGLIRVTFTDRDPKFAAEVVNAYIGEFHKHSDTLTLTEASQRRQFFQQQLLEANANLTKAEDAMKNTQESTGVLELNSQAKALIESAAVLRGQITAKEVQLQSMQALVTPDNPQYLAAQQQLDALKAQLAKVAGSKAGSGSDIGVSGTNVPEAGMAYLNALRDVRYYETIDELIAKQFELAKLDEARQGVIQVSDVAIPPDKKSSPYRALIVALMTIIAFMASVLWVLAANRWEQAKRDPEKGIKIELLRKNIHGLWR